MSVLIQGMVMPKDCYECQYGVDVDIGVGVARGCELLKDFSPISDERHEDCPLIEIPPHGRLIDADALIADIKAELVELTLNGMKGTPMWTNDLRSMLERLEDEDIAPTIIPADKEGRDEA